MICCVLSESVAAAAVGIDSTSSKEFTDMDWAPPSAAASAGSEERMMLLSGRRRGGAGGRGDVVRGGAPVVAGVAPRDARVVPRRHVARAELQDVHAAVAAPG